MATSNRKTPVHSGYTILNGTSSGKNDDRFDVWVEYKVTAQSVANNTSTVSAYFYAALKAGLSSTTRKNSGLDSTFSVGGVAGTAKSNASYDFTDPDEPNLLGSFSKTITHTADGSKSVAVKGSFTTESDYIAGGSISKTITLPTIARASVPTVSTTAPKLGAALTITTNRAASSFTHTLTYKYVGEAGASKTGTIASNVGASYNWTPPYSIANDIPTKTTVSCDITCATYNGSTLIGSNTVKVTLTVPSDATTKPSISAVLSPYHTGTIAEDDPITNFGSLVSLKGKYVKAKSRVKAVITAASAYSSGIKSYAVTVGGKTVTSAAPTIISGIIANIGSVDVKVVATDNRGFSNEITHTIDVLDHTRPKIKAFKVYRCFADGVENDEGTNLYVQATREYTKFTDENEKTDSEIAQGNLCALRVRYEAASGSHGEWIDLIPASDVSTDSYSGLLKSGGTPVEISNAASYNVAIEAYDAIGGEAPTAVGFSVPTAQTDFNLNNNKAAFGKYAEIDNTLEVDWNVRAYDNIEIRSKGTDSVLVMVGGEDEQYRAHCYCNSSGNVGLWDDVNEVAILRYNADKKKITTMAIDASLMETKGTLTGSTNVTMGVNSIKYNPFANCVFMRLGCTIKSAFNAGSSYAIATVDTEFTPAALYPLSTVAQKGWAWINGNTIYFRPFEALASGTTLYMAGFWMM